MVIQSDTTALGLPQLNKFYKGGVPADGLTQQFGVINIAWNAWLAQQPEAEYSDITKFGYFASYTQGAMAVGGPSFT